jgi:hypothetical protein
MIYMYVFMYVLKLYIYNMHMYVYCSYNESQIQYFKSENYWLSLKMDISILEIVI